MRSIPFGSENNWGLSLATTSPKTTGPGSFDSSAAHLESFGSHSDADLLVGLQLTFSGRFSRPDSSQKSAPRTTYCHPYLDQKFGTNDHSVLSDDEIKQLIDDYIAAAKLAERAGFAFVDIKHCHGYFGHELLSAVDRPGLYGGSFDNRTRFLRDVAAGIRNVAPNLELAVRVSIFDFAPYRPGADRTGAAK